MDVSVAGCPQTLIFGRTFSPQAKKKVPHTLGEFLGVFLLAEGGKKHLFLLLSRCVRYLLLSTTVTLSSKYFISYRRFRAIKRVLVCTYPETMLSADPTRGVASGAGPPGAPAEG